MVASENKCLVKSYSSFAQANFLNNCITVYQELKK